MPKTDAELLEGMRKEQAGKREKVKAAKAAKVILKPREGKDLPANTIVNIDKEFLAEEKTDTSGPHLFFDGSESGCSKDLKIVGMNNNYANYLVKHHTFPRPTAIPREYVRKVSAGGGRRKRRRTRRVKKARTAKRTRRAKKTRRAKRKSRRR